MTVRTLAPRATAREVYVRCAPAFLLFAAAALGIGLWALSGEQPGIARVAGLGALIAGLLTGVASALAPSEAKQRRLAALTMVGVLGGAVVMGVTFLG